MNNKSTFNRPYRIKSAFFWILTGCFTSFLISCIITDGSSFSLQFFIDKSDSFMDFFNPIKFTSFGNPYEFKEMGAIYPPIAYLTFSLLGKILPDLDILSAKQLRFTQAGIMEYVVFVLVCVFIVLYIIYRNYIGREFEKLLFLGCILLSSPMLYLIERGNILLFVLALIFIYITFMDSESAFLREISIICLALAAAIKLYPVVLGLLLLHKKSYVRAFRCAIYGFLFFAVPFLFYGGIQTFFTFANNLVYGISDSLFNISCLFKRVDLSTVISIPYLMIKNDFANIESVARILSVFLSIQFLIGSVLFKEKWQKVLCLTCIMLIIPPFSYAYCIVLYFVPIFLFITKKTFYRVDSVYSLLFIMLIAPFPLSSTFISNLLHFHQLLPLNILFQNIAQLGLFFVLFVQIAIYEFRKSKSIVSEKNKKYHHKIEQVG